ncbi:phosphatidate phosphatase App1 family protein [Aureliella helgolandensis]|uniref:phosphatidate phosphatase App1 family protein n=1 Tax=Aureliella helgolandensis TaxID=2527968 RepID=UPI0018D06000|nr:App1 family protein [Aureliella helgolandensis]
MNFAEPLPTSDLQPEHQAQLFPSLGYYDFQRAAWRAFVHGRVFIDGRVPIGTRLLLKGLTKAMRATPEEVASDTFQSRIDGFLSAPGRRRRIVLAIGSRQYRLRRRTRRNGSFYGTLTLPQDATAACSKNAPSALAMQLLRSTDEVGTISATRGEIHLVPTHGISVVSDIDDTIKMTEATSRKEMLANTFLRPFEVIEGMAQLYQSWETQGCAFHYVSSSPWQLYEPLAELCAASRFPSGSMHLRYFRVRDEMFKRFRPIRRNSKVGIIAGILKTLPARKFILVGDSGEKDPEIYRFLARRFPTQIVAVLIRNLESRPLDAKRLRKLRTISGTTRCKIFTKSEEIAGTIDRLKQKHPDLNHP